MFLSISEQTLFIIPSISPSDSEKNFRTLLKSHYNAVCLGPWDKVCLPSLLQTIFERPNLTVPTSTFQGDQTCAWTFGKVGFFPRGSDYLWDGSVGSNEPQDTRPSPHFSSAGRPRAFWTENVNGFWHSDSTLPLLLSALIIPVQLL